MSTSDILIRFGNYQSHLNRSGYTIEQYKLDLGLFIRYIMAKRNGVAFEGDEFDALDIGTADVKFFRDITSEEIYEFLMYTKSERDNNPSTRSRKLSSIKSLYKYLTVTLKEFEYNPAENISAPAVKTRLPKYLTLDESLALLAAVQNDEASNNRERDYAILTLFLNCGMRLGELVSINLLDISPTLQELRVVGKGSKERVIYLNSASREAVADYLEIRKKDPRVVNERALFISRLGKRMSNKTVQWVVYKYLDLAGLGHKNFSTHKLRHTAATLMYQTGNVDVRVLKDILGHEQLNTTQIYTHVSNAQMQSAMEQNPLAKIKVVVDDSTEE